MISEGSRGVDCSIVRNELSFVCWRLRQLKGLMHPVRVVEIRKKGTTAAQSLQTTLDS